MKKTERDLKGKGALDRAVAARHRKTWSGVVGLLTAQPITRLERRSRTTARYSQPSRVSI
jgi:hypothetical protein